MCKCEHAHEVRNEWRGKSLEDKDGRQSLPWPHGIVTTKRRIRGEFHAIDDHGVQVGLV